MQLGKSNQAPGPTWVHPLHAVPNDRSPIVDLHQSNQPDPTAQLDEITAGYPSWSMRIHAFTFVGAPRTGFYSDGG
jgi:hypothetical protein